MNTKTDYRLANIKKRQMKLRAMRQDILSSEPEKALEMILDAPSPATLVQSFPDQDLYYLMHRIGPYDFIPVLALARSEQWEYIMDVEVWDNDRLDPAHMTKIFDILFQADPKRLMRWIIKEKPDFFEFYLFKHMEIYIREHDEVPPDRFDDYITLDDKFYFRFPDKPKNPDEDAPPADSMHAWELIEKMLRLVADMDLSVFHGLLLETNALLTAEAEEEQFRLKNIRLAEKGFLPAHEAIGIYQPTKLCSVRRRPENYFRTDSGFDPDIPLPPQFFQEFIEGEDLLKSALRLFDQDSALVLESELAALINKVISADKIKLRTKQDIEKAINKTCACLNLGLELIMEGKPSPGAAKAAIKQYFLEDIFRTGSRAGIKLKTKASEWFEKSFMNHKGLPLSFLGEYFLGVAGGLFLERPMYFDNYRKGVLYRDFRTIEDIARTNEQLDKIIAIDMVLGRIDADTATFRQGMLTYKTLVLTLWAKNRLGLTPTLEPIRVEDFREFFIQFFSEPVRNSKDNIRQKDFLLWVSEAAQLEETQIPQAFVKVAQDLVDELEDEYASVNQNQIDPRFMPHFLLSDT
jgi:hypothetical protein